MPSMDIYRRLEKCGLRQAAEAYKEEVKLRLLREDATRKTANDVAWAEVWKELKPAVEKMEANREKAARDLEAAQAEQDTPPQLPGLPAHPREALDPNYQEADPGKRLRDGLLWVAEEFVGVITDTEAGPVANLKAASTPPPNRFALLTLATYALSPVDKRRELISRALAFAEKGHDTPQPTGDKVDEGGFLDAIE